MRAHRMSNSHQSQTNKKKHLYQLQSQWYKELEKAGFEDIECVQAPYDKYRPLKKYDATYFNDRYTVTSFYFKENYFYVARLFSQHHHFSDELERSIFCLHAEGYSLRETSAILKKINVRLSKDDINVILRNLINKMKEWHRNGTY